MILVASVALLVACGNASKKAAPADAAVQTEQTETKCGDSCTDPACKEGAEAPECINNCDSCPNKGTENCKNADKCTCETKHADCTCDKADCKCKEEAK